LKETIVYFEKTQILGTLKTNLSKPILEYFVPSATMFVKVLK
jgi:hypothetical protein